METSGDKNTQQICVIIGASHAGVNGAFALRKEGWTGKIILFDADKALPYHRPPLSKAYLTRTENIESIALKPRQSYLNSEIELRLGERVMSINREQQTITLESGEQQSYHKLILTLGASPITPPIDGIKNVQNVFSLRNEHDVVQIKSAFAASQQKRVVIIGGGYIGLETAASLKKMGASITILERESRVLARVTAPEISAFFEQLHAQHGVTIFTEKTVASVTSLTQGADEMNLKQVHCSDGSHYDADIILVGIGVSANTKLAEQAGIKLDHGILVNASACTSDKNIYAAGDCTYHFNRHYDRYIRLESVQNAVQQAKIAAAAICGKEPVYDTIPWFWSDQFDKKLQMVGLSTGYDEVILRQE